MAAATILIFENLLLFLYYWTDPHQIWWECWDSDLKCNCWIKNAYSTKNQDGGHRHLEFRKSVAISLLLNQSSPNLVVILRVWHKVQLACQKYIFTKIQDGGRRHLFLKKWCHFFTIWTNPHHIWWDRCESDVERNCSCQKRIITKFQDGRYRHL